jgi:hypothetical protein
MASKSSARAQEIRDLARAICMQLWLDTDWANMTVGSTNGARAVGQDPDRLWVQFPAQGKCLMVRFSTSFDPSPSQNHNYYCGHELIRSYSPHGASARVERAWWIMAEKQKSFSGMDLLGTRVEVLSRPTKEYEEWADSILSAYGVAKTAGYYKVILQANTVSKMEISGSFDSPEAAREAAMHNLESKIYGWRATLVQDPKIVEVEKVK